MIYEMLTRKPPFLGNTPCQWRTNRFMSFPAAFCKAKSTPKRLELIVLKAEERQAREILSVEEMLEHLDSVDPEEVERTTMLLSRAKRDDVV